MGNHIRLFGCICSNQSSIRITLSHFKDYRYLRYVLHRSNHVLFLKQGKEAGGIKDTEDDAGLNHYLFRIGKVVLWGDFSFIKINYGGKHHEIQQEHPRS